MILRITYALAGAVLGVVCGLAWDLLLGDPRPDLAGLLNPHLALWGLGGLAAGVLAVEPGEAALIGGRPHVLYQPRVETQPARCAWCGGQGRKLFLFRCPVCGGQGNVLAVRPKKPCAWCRGAGRRFLWRCPACRGAGWLHNRYH